MLWKSKWRGTCLYTLNIANVQCKNSSRTSLHCNGIICTWHVYMYPHEHSTKPIQDNEWHHGRVPEHLLCSENSILQYVYCPLICFTKKHKFWPNVLIFWFLPSSELCNSYLALLKQSYSIMFITGCWFMTFNIKQVNINTVWCSKQMFPCKGKFYVDTSRLFDRRDRDSKMRQLHSKMDKVGIRMSDTSLWERLYKLVKQCTGQSVHP